MIPNNYSDEEVQRHVLSAMNNGDFIEEDIRVLLTRFYNLIGEHDELAQTEEDLTGRCDTYSDAVENALMALRRTEGMTVGIPARNALQKAMECLEEVS